MRTVTLLITMVINDNMHAIYACESNAILINASVSSTIK